MQSNDDDENQSIYLELSKSLRRLKILSNEPSTDINNNNNSDESGTFIHNSKGKKITIHKLIDTQKDLIEVCKLIISYLASMPAGQKIIAVDLEGEKLGRSGTISILQVYPINCDEIYLFDINQLGKIAFENEDEPLYTLKHLLQSNDYTKIMYDPRADSDALYHLYGVKLRNVICVQLMNAAYRIYYQAYDMKYVMGLKKAIELDLDHIDYSLRREFLKIKENGLKLFDAMSGGSYAIFNQRPLPKAIQLYCSLDVVLLPDLYSIYKGKISHVMNKVLEETNNRVDICYKQIYASSANCPFRKHFI